MSIQISKQVQISQHIRVPTTHHWHLDNTLIRCTVVLISLLILPVIVI